MDRLEFPIKRVNLKNNNKYRSYAHGQKIGYNRSYELTQMHQIRLYQLSDYHNPDNAEKRAKAALG